jgi:dephospho-CoA kinase
MDEEEKRARCEYIIENDGDILGLKSQVADLITQLIQRSY